MAGANWFHLDEVSIIVDVDVIAPAAFAGVEAMRKARPL
jgi:hypothetical protein